jgi:hypothetical protein
MSQCRIIGGGLSVGTRDRNDGHSTASKPTPIELTQADRHHNEGCRISVEEQDGKEVNEDGGSAPKKPSEGKLPDDVKATVEAQANECVEKVLKPQHVQPPPKEPRFNYIVGLWSKWHGSYFYFGATYACLGPNPVSPAFETKFARMEYIGGKNFAVAYLRHNDKWVVMKNSIFVIKPYKWNGMWVFDDERVGLDKEPFVAGADTMIDTAVAVKGIPNAEDGFLMVFSAGPFPDADFEVLNGCGRKAEANVYKAGSRSRVTCRKWKAGSARH